MHVCIEKEKAALGTLLHSISLSQGLISDSGACVLLAKLKEQTPVMPYLHWSWVAGACGTPILSS